MQSLKCRIEDDFRPWWNWTCEDCGSPVGFFSVSPPECLMCHTPVPFDARALISKVEERIKYHVQSA